MAGTGKNEARERPIGPELQPHAAQAARFLKALANEKRLLILCVLSEGEASVGDLNRRIELSQSALSQHLSWLRREGVVQTRRESQTIYYSLTDSVAASIVDVLHEAFCKDK